MGDVNVFIHEPGTASIGIAKKIRAWGSKKVHLWICGDDLKNATGDIKRFVIQWRNLIIVEQNIRIDNSVCYFEWDSSTWQVEMISSNGLKALIHRCRMNGTPFVVLANSEKTKGQLKCFVDALQEPNLPDGWKSFRWVSSYEAIFKLCQTEGVFDFDLSNTAKFRSTGRNQQGALVYEELDTGNFIYLDNLHKTHYEVFSHMGIHLGEMPLNGGRLDRSKADPHKCYCP